MEQEPPTTRTGFRIQDLPGVVLKEGLEFVPGGKTYGRGDDAAGTRPSEPLVGRSAGAARVIAELDSDARDALMGQLQQLGVSLAQALLAYDVLGQTLPSTARSGRTLSNQDVILRLKNGGITLDQGLIANNYIDAIVKATSGPTTIEQPQESERTPELLLTQLSAYIAQLKEIEVAIDEVVQEARQQGATWEQIAESAGIRRQTAFQRWSSSAREKHNERQRSYRRAKDDDQS